MKLRIKDRIYLSQIFPLKGTFSDFLIKKSIIEKISLDDTDREFFEIKEDEDGARITWNVQKDLDNPREVEFTEAEVAHIRALCEKLQDTEQSDELWATIDKIYSEQL